MLPLNKQVKKTNTSVPPEVHEYYQAERRGRMGMTWLLSAATFVGTIVVVLGLFYGGRWIYRSTAGKKPNTPAHQAGTSLKQNTEANKTPSSSSNPSPTPPPSAPATSPPPAAAAPTPAPTPTPAPASVPNTGIGATTAIGLFVTVSTVSTVAYQVFYRKKLSLQ